MDKAKDLNDVAFGCFLGACVGDAAGAVLEFLGRQPSHEEVEHAMQMPGGGVLGVASGQITDDCELGLCLALALVGEKEFPFEGVAQAYAGWIESQPFDIGNTTLKSLGCFKEEEWLQKCLKQGFSYTMVEAAKERCADSKANGSLMRCSPLGIWGHRLPFEQLADYARLDSQLSHPNPSCSDAVACYVIAISSLHRDLGDNELAFNRAKEWAKEHACDEVNHWLWEAEVGLKVPYEHLAGFVRIAFTHAFRHLKQGTSYLDALHETLEGGGDTDTNACIVGALVGAVWGASSIPPMMMEAVLNCDTMEGRPRPSFLHTFQIPSLIQELLDSLPSVKTF